MLASTFSTHALAADEPLLLAVRINGYSTDKVGEFVLRGRALLARRSELADLGFRLPPALGGPPDDLISVSALPGFIWRVDQSTQTLYVTVTDADLQPERLQVDSPIPARATVESGTGATLNYDLTGLSAGGRITGTGFLGFRAFSPWGVASSDTLVYVGGGGPGGLGVTSAVRLDTTYTLSQPGRLRRYRVGDLITGSLSWTRALRLGGVQLSSDFSLRPDLVTFPLPSLSGSAAVPSTVDVLVNGSRLLTSQVAPGPFEIPRLPVVTGAGTISMTVTNALGRQIVLDLPFYASTALLAPGLQTYSAQLGAVRRNFGLLSNDYGELAGVATYRRGVSRTLTVEAAAEGAPGVFTGGGGLVVNVANLAVVNFAAAASAGGGLAGYKLDAGVQRLGRALSLGVSATMTSRDYQDVAALNGDPTPRLQLSANAGLQMGRFGSLGVAYAQIDRDARFGPGDILIPPGGELQNTPSQGGLTYLQPGQRARLVTANYSIQIRRLSIYATAFRDFAARDSTGILVGLTLPLGASRTAGASYGTGSGGGYGQLQSSQSAARIGDWGYQAYVSKGQTSHEFLELQYRSPWALLTAGADHIGGQTSLSLETRGSLSYLDERVFAANLITDSFAVVDTDGMAGIRVLDENRDMGRTDRGGRRLVPDLRAFDVNRLAIDATDVPADATVPFAVREVRPQDRSGIVVKFPVRISHGALLTLVDAAGAPIPIGSIATLKSTGVIVPIGFDGQAYIVDLQTRNDLTVEQSDGRVCKVAFDYHTAKGDIPDIGPLTCR